MATWHDRHIPAPVVVVGAMAGLLLVAGLDYVTGHEISFSILYLAPIALVALYGGRALLLTTCAVAAAFWYGADVASGHWYTHPLIPVWNALVRLGFFALVSLLLRRLRSELRARARLVAELQESLASVRTLRGLLPICAWCKNVRDDAGYWQRVESYVQQHTDATFTHGICPACAAKVRAELEAEDAPPPAGAPAAVGR